MGCDIHGWTERNVAGKWVAVKELSSDHGRERNYRRFAALAGVRGGGPEPLGLPIDISETANLDADGWGTDGHSHSWLPLSDALKVFLETNYGDTDKYGPEYWCWYFFGVEPTDKNPIDQYRLVFWFDN